MRRRLPAAALAAAVCLLAAACQSSTPAAIQLNPTSVAPKSAQAAAKYLAITPAPGTKDANPADGITVSARNGGKLGNVSVHTSGDAVTGSLSDGGNNWHSTWTLDTGKSYTVTATGTDEQGHPVTSTSTFTTLTPSTAFHTSIYEGQGATYGVGMPIILSFDHPITNKAAVERSLQVTTSKPVIGAWYWDGSQELYFRPRDYWPAYTTVSFTGHLNGVEGAPGVYGVHNLTQTFSIGQSVIAVASTTDHHTLIYVGGQVQYNWPISTGRATMPTPDGTYLTVEKGNPVRMIGGTKGTAWLLQRAGQLGGAVHLQRRLLPFGPLVGRRPGHHEREPRLREPAAGGRPDLLQHGDPRRPDHDHQQPEGRQLGRRLDPVVPRLEPVPAGQRHAHGGRGGPVRQQVRQPVVASRGYGHGSGRYLHRRELLRRLRESPRARSGK